MKRFLMVLALCFFAFNAVFAQGGDFKDITHEYEYESFSSVKVYDDFIVRLTTSDKYLAVLRTDARLEKYVKTYVQNGVLYVNLDRKSFSSDLKKSLRVKGAPAPVLEVMISFPSIKSLEMNGNSILKRSDVIYSDDFTLTLNDKARADKMFLECQSAELTLSKSSYADVETRIADKLYVTTSNTSKAVVKQSGSGLRIDASGSSMVDAIVEVDSIEVLASGMAETKFISGSAGDISVTASGSSKVDAESLAISKAAMLQTGSSKCYMNITDTVRVNLTGNSLMTFKNKPYIDVERIVGSTLIKADDPKRK